jgi:O-antigen/teichoic acid export membrane protein
MGVVSFVKEMRFGLDVRFAFLSRLVSFVVTLASAVWLRSYWALVAGTLAGRLWAGLLSYRMHPMRPRVSLEKWREILSVSQWMLVRSIGNHLDHNLHKILVGGRSSVTTMGGYSLANDIAAMPASEVLAPTNRALFPTLVEARHDPVELKRLFLLAQGVQTLIVLPASVGLALVAREAVPVLLGEKWLLAVPFVQLLAIANVAQAITTSGGYVMMTLGRVYWVALFSWAQVLFFAAGAFVVLPSADALHLAWLRVYAAFAGILLHTGLLMRVLPNLRLRDLAGTVSRPLLGTGLMALAVLAVGDLRGLEPVARLILKVVIGLASYSVAVAAAWRLVGAPASAEDYLMRKAGRVWRRVGPFMRIPRPEEEDQHGK